MQIPGSRIRMFGAEADFSWKISDVPSSLRTLLPSAGQVLFHSNHGSHHWVAWVAWAWGMTSTARLSSSTLPWVAGHLVNFPLKHHL